MLTPSGAGPIPLEPAALSPKGVPDKRPDPDGRGGGKMTSLPLCLGGGVVFLEEFPDVFFFVRLVGGAGSAAGWGGTRCFEADF